MGGDCAGCGVRGKELFRYAFSSRDDGNMSFVSGDIAGAEGNRKAFLAGQGIRHADLVMPRQVHGCRIELAGPGHRGKGSSPAVPGIPDTDALVTRERGLPLGVLTADCLPVFVFDPATPSAAIVHAGWRSTRERIAARTVEMIRAEFGADPAALRCFLGPAIRPCCYEVGEELARVFPRSVVSRGDKFRLDLAAENSRQLREAGVPEANIADSGLCTCCGAGFFSYRREGDASGRILSVVMIR